MPFLRLLKSKLLLVVASKCNFPVKSYNVTLDISFKPLKYKDVSTGLGYTFTTETSILSIDSVVSL